MPTRSKTVEFVFPTDQSTLAAGTKRALPSQTVYLPEFGKVFRSVTLEIGFTDHVTAASSATSFALEILLGSGSADTVTITDTVTNSGESSVHHVSRDVTSYFTANWSGTSMSTRAAITVGTNATNNHWAKLRITYDYDDASTTHAMTRSPPSWVFPPASRRRSSATCFTTPRATHRSSRSFGCPSPARQRSRLARAPPR